MTSQNNSSENPWKAASSEVRELVLNTLILTVIAVVAVAALGIHFREEIADIASWAVGTFGYTGLFFGVFVTDAFTVPIPADTYLLVTVAHAEDTAMMLTICCVASVVAGTVAYLVGPYIGRFRFFRKRIERYRERGERLFRRYGVWTVAIGALTPVPFSIVCWFAGAYKMAYPRFLLATLARIPRLVGYYALYVLGWA